MKLGLKSSIFPRSKGLSLFLWLILGSGLLPAQTDTNAPASIPDPTLLETPGATAHAAPAFVPPAAPIALPADAAAPAPPAHSDSVPPTDKVSFQAESIVARQNADRFESTFFSLLTLSALAGFLLYQCGQTRAKNCAHTSVLLLFGVTFALVGYWAGGFAVQMGGVGDSHAALPAPLPAAESGALDHELGLMIFGHHWGFMGSAGFFLITDDATRDGVAALFLGQAVLLAMAIAASLGAALERGRLLALAAIAFLAGAVIFPLVANWVWGGGWLAELGREHGWGHGVVDVAGAGVIHESAGALALAIALALGPRHNRFRRNYLTGIPGHNVPFTILGTLVLLIAFASSVSIGSGGASPGETAGSRVGLAAVNVLLGALGGMIVSVFFGAYRRQRGLPVRFCRGLLGGAISICGGAMFFDSWAAFLIGAFAGFLVAAIVAGLEALGVDDPAGVTAIHGACGGWGLIAVGIFANGSASLGLNGVETPMRGLFFGGGWHQFAPQFLGCIMIFGAVFGLGYLAIHLVKKIVGMRVKLADELKGLDWPQVGALGYQPDVDSSDDEDRWYRLE
jgi:Amt family ammonium transporter